jgi:hypothetical protein
MTSFAFWSVLISGFSVWSSAEYPRMRGRSESSWPPPVQEAIGSETSQSSERAADLSTPGK